MNIKDYNSLVFDCDGVILNSNKIKTEAFRTAVSSYGEEASNQLVSYHLLHGGVSRYKKFDYFLSAIAPKFFNHSKKLSLSELLEIYSKETEKRLLNAELAFGLDILRNAMPDKSWSIVSGGDQDELRSIFKEREISQFFDGGIYGSPENKDEILNREIINNNIALPALYLGDSKLDHQAAQSNGLDFNFVSEWTDFKGYETYCEINSIKVIRRVYDIKAEI